MKPDLRLARLVLTCLAAGALLALAPGRAAAAPATSTRPAGRDLGLRAVEIARGLVGVPYRWGGTSPRSGFDCSGLVRFVYGRVGISLPHSSYADFGLGSSVAPGRLRPGDLVFFDGLGHVGIYAGDGMFIHAPHSGTRVSYATLAAYGSTYDGARRLLR
ncbi:MAG TPA: C40 family peptidase [Gaiellaceae bacterium]|nr:C40 family peptidase [Gaiellaceae bacterium]